MCEGHAAELSILLDRVTVAEAKQRGPEKLSLATVVRIVSMWKSLAALAIACTSTITFR